MELSYDVRLGVIFNVEKSIAWDNLEDKVLNVGLNIHVCVCRVTGSITCGRGWESAFANTFVLDDNREFGEQV